MSIDALRRLRNTWQNNQSLQRSVNTAFDAVGFTADHVALLTSKNFERSIPRKSKQIKDNQWGMIEFDWRAMRLIDSGPLQRLRFIKQLGFSYLTYPSAEHSRFSHSLGIGHVVSRFLTAIDRRADESNIQKEPGGVSYVRIKSIPDLLPDDLIHAALLHDIGHMPFSHVTEKIIANQPQLFTCGKRSVEQLLLEVNTTLKKNLPLSECLTILFVLSERFDRFYCEHVCPDLPDPRSNLLTICSLIAGLPPTPKLTGLSELISGAVDADKVDYVNRDALNCGIPVGVDVARVFLRSGVIKATRKQIRELGLKASPPTDEYLFVINSSGLDTIDEILQARTALYQRVYFHAVTRTAERLLASALEANAASNNADPQLTDALSLWSQRDVTLLQRLLTSSNFRVRRSSGRIAHRTFPKKAYSFSPGLGELRVPIDDILPMASMSSITEIKKQVNNTVIEGYLREEHLLKGAGTAIEKDIRREADKILRILRTGNDLAIRDEFRGQVLDCLLIVGNAHEKQKRHNPIICQNNRLLTVRDYTNAREQQDAFELLKEIGFVLCDEPLRAVVFFAARIILARLGNTRTDVELRFNPASANNKLQLTENIRFVTRFLPDYDSSMLRSGIPAASVEKVEKSLSDSGYFDLIPWACEPWSPESAGISDVAQRLSKFDGYRSWRVTERSAAAFVSQFPPFLRDEMVDALNEITVIDSQTAVADIAPILQNLKTPIDIVPFSATSGTQVQTWLRKELGSTKDFRFPADLRAALAGGKSDPIVFVDDNAASGVQARAQFLSLLGIAKSRWPEECRAEHDLFSALNSSELKLFKERSVHLVVSAGTPQAKRAIIDCLNDIGFAAFSGLQYGRKIVGRRKWSPKMKKYLIDVGQACIAWTRFQKEFEALPASAKRICSSNALGYGNAGGWVTTNLSVPTATVTALWSPGMFHGQPWMPLLMRTGKLMHLVVA